MEGKYKYISNFSLNNTDNIPTFYKKKFKTVNSWKSKGHKSVKNVDISIYYRKGCKKTKVWQTRQTDRPMHRLIETL